MAQEKRAWHDKFSGAGRSLPLPTLGPSPPFDGLGPSLRIEQKSKKGHSLLMFFLFIESRQHQYSRIYSGILNSLGEAAFTALKFSITVEKFLHEMLVLNIKIRNGFGQFRERLGVKIFKLDRKFFSELDKG